MDSRHPDSDKDKDHLFSPRSSETEEDDAELWEESLAKTRIHSSHYKHANAYRAIHENANAYTYQQQTQGQRRAQSSYNSPSKSFLNDGAGVSGVPYNTQRWSQGQGPPPPPQQLLQQLQLGQTTPSGSMSKSKKSMNNALSWDLAHQDITSQREAGLQTQGLYMRDSRDSPKWSSKSLSRIPTTSAQQQRIHKNEELRERESSPFQSLSRQKANSLHLGLDSERAANAIKSTITTSNESNAINETNAAVAATAAAAASSQSRLSSPKTVNLGTYSPLSRAVVQASGFSSRMGSRQRSNSFTLGDDSRLLFAKRDGKMNKSTKLISPPGNEEEEDDDDLDYERFDPNDEREEESENEDRGNGDKDEGVDTKEEEQEEEELLVHRPQTSHGWQPSSIDHHTSDVHAELMNSRMTWSLGEDAELTSFGATTPRAPRNYDPWHDENRAVHMHSMQNMQGKQGNAAQTVMSPGRNFDNRASPVKNQDLAKNIVPALPSTAVSNAPSMASKVQTQRTALDQNTRGSPLSPSIAASRLASMASAPKAESVASLASTKREKERADMSDIKLEKENVNLRTSGRPPHGGHDIHKLASSRVDPSLDGESRLEQAIAGCKTNEWQFQSEIEAHRKRRIAYKISWLKARYEALMHLLDHGEHMAFMIYSFVYAKIQSQKALASSMFHLRDAAVKELSRKKKWSMIGRNPIMDHEASLFAKQVKFGGFQSSAFMSQKTWIHDGAVASPAMTANSRVSSASPSSITSPRYAAMPPSIADSGSSIKPKSTAQGEIQLASGTQKVWFKSIWSSSGGAEPSSKTAAKPQVVDSDLVANDSEKLFKPLSRNQSLKPHSEALPRGATVSNRNTDQGSLAAANWVSGSYFTEYLKDCDSSIPDSTSSGSAPFQVTLPIQLVPSKNLVVPSNKSALDYETAMLEEAYFREMKVAVSAEKRYSKLELEYLTKRFPKLIEELEGIRSSAAMLASDIFVQLAASEAVVETHWKSVEPLYMEAVAFTDAVKHPEDPGIVVVTPRTSNTAPNVKLGGNNKSLENLFLGTEPPLENDKDETGSVHSTDKNSTSSHSETSNAAAESLVKASTQASALRIKRQETVQKRTRNDVRDLWLTDFRYRITSDSQNVHFSRMSVQFDRDITSPIISWETHRREFIKDLVNELHQLDESLSMDMGSSYIPLMEALSSVESHWAGLESQIDRNAWERFCKSVDTQTLINDVYSLNTFMSRIGKSSLPTLTRVHSAFGAVKPMDEVREMAGSNKLGRVVADTTTSAIGQVTPKVSAEASLLMDTRNFPVSALTTKTDFVCCLLAGGGLDLQCFCGGDKGCGKLPSGIDTGFISPFQSLLVLRASVLERYIKPVDETFKQLDAREAEMPNPACWASCIVCITLDRAFHIFSLNPELLSIIAEELAADEGVETDHDEDIEDAGSVHSWNGEGDGDLFQKQGGESDDHMDGDVGEEEVEDEDDMLTQMGSMSPGASFIHKKRSQKKQMLSPDGPKPSHRSVSIKEDVKEGMNPEAGQDIGAPSLLPKRRRGVVRAAVREMLVEHYAKRPNATELPQDLYTPLVSADLHFCQIQQQGSCIVIRESYKKKGFTGMFIKKESERVIIVRAASSREAKSWVRVLKGPSDAEFFVQDYPNILAALSKGTASRYRLE